MTNRNLRGKIYFIIELIIFLLLFYLGISAIFHNNNRSYVFAPAISILAAVLMLAILLFGIYLIGKIKGLMECSKKKINLILLVTLFILFPVQLLFIKCFYGPIGFDVSNVVACAVGGDLQAYSSYLSWYPNNHMLVCILTMLLKIYNALHLNDIWLFLDIINIIITDVTIFFAAKIAFLLGSKRQVWTSTAILILIMGFTPWLVEPYSDTFCMPFMVIGLYALLQLRDGLIRRRLAESRLEENGPALKNADIIKSGLYILTGIFCAGMSYLIKPQAVIPYIAFILLTIYNVGFAKAHNKSNSKTNSQLTRKRNGSFAVGLMVGAMLGVFLLFGCVQVKNNMMDSKDFTYDSNKNFTALHYMNMGLSGEVGAYNADNVWFSDGFATVSERNAGNAEQIRQKLAEKGIKGYLKFVGEKLRYVTGSGMFGWYENPSFMSRSENAFQSGIAYQIQNIMTPGSKSNLLYAYVMQGVWIVALFFMGLPSFYKKTCNTLDCRDTNVFHVKVLQLAIFGLMLFTCLFEASTRYLVHAIPIYVILTVNRVENIKIISRHF